MCRLSSSQRRAHPPARPLPHRRENKQTSASQIIIYAIHVTQQQVLPIPVHGAPAGPSARAAGAVGGSASARVGQFLGEPRELTELAITAKEAALLPHTAAATAICCDARTLVVGFADGCLVALSWSAKVGPLWVGGKGGVEGGRWWCIQSAAAALTHAHLS